MDNDTPYRMNTMAGELFAFRAHAELDDRTLRAGYA